MRDPVRIDRKLRMQFLIHSDVRGTTGVRRRPDAAVSRAKDVSLDPERGMAVAERQEEAIMRKLVRDAMTPNPQTIGGGASVVEAAQLMDRADVGAIPVVDGDDILVGIVTDRDIAVRVVAASKDPGSTTVADIATTSVSPAYPNEPLDDALEQMAYRQVRRLPVIEDDRVVGMLAQADMVHELKDKAAGRLVDEISHEPQRIEV